MARRPRIAKAFEVNTRNGSCVTAKIAGMESIAKTMSVTSTSTSTMSSGVAMRRPARRTVNRCPTKSSVVGTKRWNSRTVRLFATSMCSLRVRAMR